MSQKLLILIVVIVTALAAFIMTKNKAPARQRPQAASVAVPVQAVTSISGGYQVMLPSQGIARARTETVISAQVSGNITDVSDKYSAGAFFEKGEWILSIDDRDYQASLMLSEASVDRAQLSITQEQANAVLAKKNWDRLNPGEKATDLVLRKPQLASARSELKSAQAQYETAKLTVERSKITAPFSGKLTDKAVDVGQYLTPGKAIASLVATENLEIELPVSAKWRSFIDWKDGKNPDVKIYIGEDTDNAGWNGQIVNVSATIDEQSRQLVMFAQVPAKNESGGIDLLVGDYVTAKISGKVIQDVIALPRETLVDGNAIWIIRDDKLYKEPVNVVWMDVNDVVIENTLPPKTLVNITALGYVVSGVPVRLIELDGVEIKSTEPARGSFGTGGKKGSGRPDSATGERGSGRPSDTTGESGTGSTEGSNQGQSPGVGNAIGAQPATTTE